MLRTLAVGVGVLLTLAPSSATVPGQTVDHRATFPLGVSADGRHLADRSGRPFLVVGDTAWSLVAQLSEDDVAHYLDDRARRGFTAIIVNLIEHRFATNAPANRQGVQPFLSPGDFARPNAAYLAAAHRAVAEAGRRGIAVWLCPAYLGWDGGDEGFFKEIAKAGPAALRQYGRFVGARFKDLHNIVWMLGGDYALSPPQRWVGDDLAAAIGEGGARQIMTAHGGQTTAMATYGQRPWLVIETVYSYKKDLGPELHAAYRAQPVRSDLTVSSPTGAGAPAVSAAAASDGSFVLYVAADGTARSQQLTLRLQSLLPAARWFNPARDEPERLVDATRTSEGRLSLRTPGDNGTGANDWVLAHTAQAPRSNR